MRLLSLALLCLACLGLAAPASARPTAPPPRPPSGLHAEVAASGRLVVHVIVPLCHGAQVDCGSARAGDPDDLTHNLYWGAAFGQHTYFRRKASAFTRVSATPGAPGDPLLARATFRREVTGTPFGREGPVELVVVFDAYHGDAIDQAVDAFFHATEDAYGLEVADREGTRTLPVQVVGFTGHNRMMDGKKAPPFVPRPGLRPRPSFVLACDSRSTFAAPLAERGSAPLLLTQALMAPEGYVVEGVLEALAAGRDRRGIRLAAGHAYAHWQRIERAAGLGIFAPAE